MALAPNTSHMIDLQYVPRKILALTKPNVKIESLLAKLEGGRQKTNILICSKSPYTHFSRQKVPKKREENHKRSQKSMNNKRFKLKIEDCIEILPDAFTEQAPRKLSFPEFMLLDKNRSVQQSLTERQAKSKKLVHAPLEVSKNHPLKTNTKEVVNQSHNIVKQSQKTFSNCLSTQLATYLFAEGELKEKKQKKYKPKIRNKENQVAMFPRIENLTLKGLQKGNKVTQNPKLVQISPWKADQSCEYFETPLQFFPENN